MIAKCRTSHELLWPGACSAQKVLWRFSSGGPMQIYATACTVRFVYEDINVCLFSGQAQHVHTQQFSPQQVPQVPGPRPHPQLFDRSNSGSDFSILSRMDKRKETRGAFHYPHRTTVRTWLSPLPEPRRFKPMHSATEDQVPPWPKKPTAGTANLDIAFILWKIITYWFYYVQAVREVPNHLWEEALYFKWNVYNVEEDTVI